MFTIERHQHAVGHGFFHTASVHAHGGPRFNYVYDCGAKKDKTILAPAIAAYLESLGRSVIDLLVLSHFHDDHVSGLDRLLARTKIDTVIIPYIPDAERLLLVAQLLTHPAAGWDDVALPADPEKWFRSRGVDRILSVYPSDETSSTADGPEQSPEPRQNGGKELGWELRLGSEKGQVLKTDDDSFSDGSPVVLTHEHMGVLEFLFFCWNAKEQADRYKKAIMHETDKTPTELLHPDQLLLTLHNASLRKKIVKCYRDVSRKRLNWTTLCLRVGPAGSIYESRYSLVRCGTGPTPLLIHRMDTSEGAWLGTGDLELADPKISSAFFERYAPHGPVRTLSLPHHGSHKNFDGELLSLLKPSVVFATCPPKSRYHPDEKVVRAVSGTGTVFLKVDESVESQLHESVCLCRS
jgi:hypothetical protein